jgi:hypothetical protein
MPYPTEYNDDAYPTKKITLLQPIGYDGGVLYPIKEDYPSPIKYEDGVYPTKDD